jgi:hypothetical protein
MYTKAVTGFAESPALLTNNTSFVELARAILRKCGEQTNRIKKKIPSLQKYLSSTDKKPRDKNKQTDIIFTEQ